MKIALPEPLLAYVAQRVASGEYGNTSEYVRELIRKDQRDQRIERLRALVQEGLSSGPATPDCGFDSQKVVTLSFAKRFIGAENLPTRLSEFDVSNRSACAWPSIPME